VHSQAWSLGASKTNKTSSFIQLEAREEFLLLLFFSKRVMAYITALLYKKKSNQKRGSFCANFGKLREKFIFCLK